MVHSTGGVQDSHFSGAPVLNERSQIFYHWFWIRKLGKWTIRTSEPHTPFQSAYKLGHSTKTALLSIRNIVHLALARDETTTVVLLDQSAAFDTTDHGTVLECLSSWFGIGGVVLE